MSLSLRHVSVSNGTIRTDFHKPNLVQSHASHLASDMILHVGSYLVLVSILYLRALSATLGEAYQ